MKGESRETRDVGVQIKSLSEASCTQSEKTLRINLRFCGTGALATTKMKGFENKQNTRQEFQNGTTSE